MSKNIKLVQQIFITTLFHYSIFWRSKIYKIRPTQYFSAPSRVFSKSYENKLKSIFDQWEKLDLFLNAQHEIQISEVI